MNNEISQMESITLELDTAVLDAAVVHADIENIKLKEWVQAAVAHHAERREDALWGPSYPDDKFALILFVHMYLNCRHELFGNWAVLAALVDAEDEIWRVEPLEGIAQEYARECSGDCRRRTLDVVKLRAVWPQLVVRAF